MRIDAGLTANMTPSWDELSALLTFAGGLLPRIIDLPAITPLAWLELATTMLLVIVLIDLGYIVLAARARRLLRSPRALRIANRARATILGGAAATLATQ
jgi:threonine/homoserine/homoserine lactone efflux protein